MPNAINAVWVLASAALVMSMQVGFCMLEAGLVRSKNSINVAIKNLIDFCVASLLFWALGYALMFGDSATGWIGWSDFAMEADAGMGVLVFFLFQLMFCATAATIVSGAVAERMSFSSYIFVTAIISAIIYPIGGGWAWNDQGWLRELGFRDFAGSSVVHSVGGWVALAAVIILGPRTGRFDSKNALVSSHSLVISTLGVLVLFVGWLGFNGGSTLAFDARVPVILLNTTLAGSAGCLAALASVWAHKKLPELPPTLNGCVGGLVAITAGCNAVTPLEAVAIGAIGGILSYAAVLALDWLRLDDVVGASAAHAAPGVWGTLAVGLFGSADLLDTGLTRGQQIGVQALGVAAFFAWAFGGGWLLLKLINRLRPMRIEPDYERVGLNVAEHGASTEIIDLLNEMARHSYKGEFNERLAFEPFTEVGQIASQYNRVIDKVMEEMELREGIARHLQSARDESESANRKIFSSLQYARRIQNSILPTPRKMRGAIGDHFVLYEPRDVVSGDFYWCGSVEGKQFCALVDCTGHGVPGAFMSMIGYLLLERTIVERRILEPAEILAELHRRVRLALAQDKEEGAGNRDGMEIALVRLDENGLVFAGAQRPLWIVSPAAQGHDFVELPGDRHGIGGGSLEPPEIRFTQHSIPARPGVTFYLQSDGLVQQPNHLKMIYDRGRFQDLLTSIQGHPIGAQARLVADSFAEFRGGATQRDDVSVLGFRPWGDASDAAPLAAMVGRDASDHLFVVEGRITAKIIAECGAILREQLPISINSRLNIFGAFVELAQNVVRHSDERENDAGIGKLFARRVGETLLLGSVNKVNAENGARLATILDEITHLGEQELRELYLARLHERKGDKLESGGLGLIDLARKALHRPDIGFEKLDCGMMRFSLIISLGTET